MVAIVNIETHTVSLYDTDLSSGHKFMAAPVNPWAVAKQVM